MSDTAVANGPVDRRRHARAKVEGRVVIHGPEGIARGVIVDLGSGGVLVRELGRLAPLDVATTVSIELEVTGLGWVTQPGTVVRHDRGTVAVAFAGANPRAAISDRTLDPGRIGRCVVVLDPSASRRRRVAAALRAAGYCSLEAATPLELVDLLERAHGEIAAIALAPRTETQTRLDELVGFLSEVHPGVRLTLIGDDPSPVRDLLAGLT